ncbi:hypothetical protein [Pseudoxanthomonas sp. PXM01]|uniref:hypothetical protein n=1 Tax=Pseudoxanthomonas sp. PXM01 TaxID=2769295 RepID=UPI0017828140|nr:hypothetical protein [Pseudoxanthomonas sp. PXM01]
MGKVVEVEGGKYKVLRFVDSARTGHQGTIYPHVESDEEAVAHQQQDVHRQPLEPQTPAELTR